MTTLNWSQELQALLSETSPYGQQTDSNPLAFNVPPPANPAPLPPDAQPGSYVPCTCGPLDIACQLKCTQNWPGGGLWKNTPAGQTDPGASGNSCGCGSLDLGCNFNCAVSTFREPFTWFIAGFLLFAVGTVVAIKA